MDEEKAMLAIDLKGKIAFVAGVADDQGYGWAIAKALYAAGATVVLGVWPPAYKIFTMSFESGKFDESRRLSDGRLLEFAKIYPLDAVYDNPEQVPEEVRENKRYKDFPAYTISEIALQVAKDFGTVDCLVHCLANGPEVKNPLLSTSRAGYLAAVSSSAYSFVSFIAHFGPHMSDGASALCMTYLASEKAVPGYGGGMSSAKAALESDTRTLAFEAGRKWGLRINAISAGALKSRAAKAIGFIEKMINYGEANAPLKKSLEAEEVGNVAAFMLSSLASAVTGTTFYVDNGMHAMGLAIDSAAFTAEGS